MELAIRALRAIETIREAADLSDWSICLAAEIDSKTIMRLRANGRIGEYATGRLVALSKMHPAEMIERARAGRARERGGRPLKPIWRQRGCRNKPPEPFQGPYRDPAEASAELLRRWNAALVNCFGSRP